LYLVSGIHYESRICIWNFSLLGSRVYPFTTTPEAFTCCRHLLEMTTQFPTTYWHWIVPLNNAQMGLGALGELRCRAEEQTADHILASCSCTTFQMGHLVWRLSMLSLWTGFKQHFASDESVDLNEEEEIWGKTHHAEKTKIKTTITKFLLRL